MSAFIRIKNYIINLEALAYARIENDYVALGFTFHSEELKGQNYIRFQKGSDLQDAEFEQVKEFLLQLPEVDRVIAI